MARRPKPPGARKRPKRGLRDAVRHTPPAETTPPLQAIFDRSAARVAQAPPDIGREVAFAGRSNAGKSSALNRLTNRRGLARTSRTPGRTQLLNFFNLLEGTIVEGEGDEDPAIAMSRLVDLPGYGYAQANLATRDAWQQHVEDYLARRESLVGLVLLMDIRHPFQAFDEHMIAWAETTAMPTLLLLNKADKLSRGASLEALRAARGRVASIPNVEPMLFSALRGTGAEEALGILRAWLLEDAADAGSDAAVASETPIPE